MWLLDFSGSLIPLSFPVSFGEMALGTWVYMLLRVHLNNEQLSLVVVLPRILLTIDQFVSLMAVETMQLPTPCCFSQTKFMIWPSYCMCFEDYPA